MKKYTIEEIENYLKSQDSLGDIHYNLSEENIDKAQPQLPVKITNCNNGEILLELDQSYIDDEVGILDKIIEYYNFIEEEITESEILMDLVEFLDENDLMLTID